MAQYFYTHKSSQAGTGWSSKVPNRRPDERIPDISGPVRYCAARAIVSVGVGFATLAGPVDEITRYGMTIASPVPYVDR